MNRSELREIIIKVIYQYLILSRSKIDYDLDSLIKEFIEVENDFVNTSVKGIIEHEEELTKLANKYLESWSLNRLNKVAQAITLLGVYELKYTNTPGIVVINEGIELSKKYSDEKLTKMINAVLDQIYHHEVDHE